VKVDKVGQVTNLACIQHRSLASAPTSSIHPNASNTHSYSAALSTQCDRRPRISHKSRSPYRRQPTVTTATLPDLSNPPHVADPRYTHSLARPSSFSHEPCQHRTGCWEYHVIYGACPIRKVPLDLQLSAATQSASAPDNFHACPA
jgi:hypothetical protein